MPIKELFLHLLHKLGMLEMLANAGQILQVILNNACCKQKSPLGHGHMKIIWGLAVFHSLSVLSAGSKHITSDRKQLFSKGPFSGYMYSRFRKRGKLFL